MTDIVLCDVSERIATITLNRPEARNALSSEVLRLLPQRLREVDADDAVDVIILTGTDPAFCAGLDLKELGSTGANLGAGGAGGRGPFPDLAKPIIGAVNGPAITGGFELALACDFLVASDRARFGDTHARVGVMPGWGLTVLLPQAIGVRRAREMSYTGNFLTADEALQWGLVNHVVDHAELLPVHPPPGPRHRVERPAGRAPDPLHVRRAWSGPPSTRAGRSSGVTPTRGCSRAWRRPRSSAAAKRSANEAAPKPDHSRSDASCGPP